MPINNAGITLDNISIRLTEENWKSFGCKLNCKLFNVQICNKENAKKVW